MAWAGVLAHQGGWDEILFVTGPLLLFAGMLLLARRRAKAEAEARDADRGGANAEARDADRGGADQATPGQGS